MLIEIQRRMPCIECFYVVTQKSHQRNIKRVYSPNSRIFHLMPVIITCYLSESSLICLLIVVPTDTVWYFNIQTEWT